MFTNNRSLLQTAIGRTTPDIGHLIEDIIPYIFGIAGILVLVYLVLGGFGIMTSKGDPKALEAARAKITYAIIGFVIIFAGFWLTQLLGLATGVSQIGNFLK